MGILRKLGSLFGLNRDSGGAGNAARKRGTSSGKTPLVEERKTTGRPDAYDVRKQFQEQAAAAEAERNRAERAERYLPGFFTSYTQWAAERTKQKVRGQLPKDYPIDVGRYQQELRKEKEKIQARLWVENAPKRTNPNQQTGQPSQRVPVSPRTGTSTHQPTTPLELFLAGEFVPVTSSNVGQIAYVEGEQKLMVIFLDMNEYEYHNVSRAEAESLFAAGSKGGWVWDHLRVRGTKLGHQKPYAHVAGHGSVQRKWIQSQASIKEHLRKVDEQSQEAGHGKAAMIPGALFVD